MSKKYVSLSKLSTFLDNLNNKFATLSHKHTVADITDYKVDTALSSTSVNPVQNKVVDAEFEAISEAMQALESAIDEKLAGEHNHDDRYYTETEIDAKVSTINTSITNITNGTTKVGKAVSADSATTATTATSATSATKATQDGNGKVISSTYETKSDASAKLDEAKGYTDTSVGELSEGFSSVIYQMYGDDISENGAPTIRAIANDEANTALESAKSYTDTAVSGKANSSHTHTIANVTNLQSTLDGKVPTSRTINGKALTANISLSASDVGAAASSHSHNDIYYTETEIDTKLAAKADSDHNHNSAYDTKGSAAEVQENLDVVSDSLDTHTENSDIHVTSTNKSQWNTAYSHSTSTHAPSNAEKNIIVGIQKNGTDLTVDSSTRKVNITVPTTAAEIGAASSTHNHDDKYDTKGAADTALASAKTYADSAATKVKDDLLNGAGTAYDTLKELGVLIDNNADAIEALETIASGKADSSHTHAIADVSGLQTALDGKAASSHGTHVSYSTTAPVMDGTASVGTATTVARSDHKHPTDTSRAAKSDLDALSDVVDGKSDSGHTHTVSHTPAGSISETSITPAGSVTSEFTGTAASHNHTFTGTEAKHKHTFTGTQATISTDYTPVGSVSSSFTGTEASTTSISGTTTVASNAHTHSVTAAGSVSQPTFTGTKATISTDYTPVGSVSSSFTGSASTSGAPNGTTPTTTVASSTHTHKYTPSGTVSKPTFTGSAVTSAATADSGKTTVYSITAVGSLPSLTTSVTNRCLTFTFGAGSLPTKGSGVSVATGGHTHSVTAAGSVSQPTFTGTEASTTSITGTASVASSGHTHSVTATGSVTSTFTGTEDTISVEYTPAGIVSKPTFTGSAVTSGTPSATANVATSTHTHKYTPAGGVTSTFTGTEDTISATYTPAGSISETAVTPAGTISDKSLTPAGTIESTFTGTAAKHKHTFTGTAASLTTSADN